MKQLLNIMALLTLCMAMSATITSCRDNDANSEVPSTKRERNSIKEGNDLYEKKRYAEAEVSYKKALEENQENATAQFNLASTYLKQRGEDLTNKEDSLIKTADSMLAKVSQTPNAKLSENAFYDRGNVAYKAEDYASAIEHYKNALRRNPDNDMARQNLRLAQLKKQEQEQDQNQQNQNQNQDQDQDKDQNQDNKQQNKDQNQNQDQNKDQNNDKQDQQQNQQNKQEQQQEKQQQQQQQGGLSDASAQQILKAMEDKENGTRQKVELMKQGEEKRANRRSTEKPW